MIIRFCIQWYIWDSRQFFPALLYMDISSYDWYLGYIKVLEILYTGYWRQQQRNFAEIFIDRRVHSLTRSLAYLIFSPYAPKARAWGIKWHVKHFGTFQSAMKHFFLNFFLNTLLFWYHKIHNNKKWIQKLIEWNWYQKCLIAICSSWIWNK